MKVPVINLAEIWIGFPQSNFARSQEEPSILIVKLSMRVFPDETMEKRFK